MPSSPGNTRLWITAALLMGSFVLLNSVSHGERIIPRQPLAQLDYGLGEWSGKEQPLPEETQKAVGVSDYTHRIYQARGGPPIELYVGYYASQRTGDTIHSPKNCLPGAGWEPVHAGYIKIPVGSGREIQVNEYLIQQDQNRQLVFYWYQGRGRIIASEYLGKFWMVVDAISRNRTDGALVRLNTFTNDDETAARSRLIAFTQVLSAPLDKLIPN
jgi:EpsI family protein